MSARGGRGLVAVLALAAVSLPASSADDPRVMPALTEARAAADELTASLKALLQTELAAAGFDGAVRVCAEQAQERTRAFSARAGHAIRRVSLKQRNPANTPDAFERGVLEAFERLPAEGRANAEQFAIVREGGRDTLRYMRPLLTGPLCLTCHGPVERIPPAVLQLLAQRYPDDRATGFTAGAVRGAVSVRIELPSVRSR
jgi:hypothetical protein